MTHKIFIISITTCCIFVFLTQKGLCQELDTQTPRLEIVSAYVLPGFTTVSLPANTLADFRTLAPESEILNQDFSSYEDNNSWGASGLGYFAPAVGIRFNQDDGTASNHFIMRVGVSYAGGILLHEGRFKSTSVPYDTLISVQTGEETYVDSVYSKSIAMEYSSSFLLLDVSFLWSTNFDARFQAYGGIGLAAGLSFNAATSIREYENAYGYERRYDNYDNGSESERFSNQSGFCGNVYLPIGIDWRLGNKGFWGAIHIVSEFRPALAVYTIPELDSYVSPSFGFLTGIKVGW